MNLYTIDTGFFKLDGGAMFGVVPKVLWQKHQPPDEKNYCRWAMRCLLIEEGNRLILIDTGLGNKQSEKFFSFFQPHGEDSLIGSIKKHGFCPADVTDVVLTHLHFDHCGGAVYRQGEHLRPLFTNATYWSNEGHWDWASDPNAREKASFLKENFYPIKESGQLKFINQGEKLTDNISFIEANGHTEKMLIPHINYKGKTLVFMADLLPSPSHMPLPWVMGYDIRPLVTVKEKEGFLTNAVNNDYVLFFEHDPTIECCSLKMTDKGVRPDQFFSLNEWI